MKNQMKKQTGITLIALVITIIVLLILAGVSIATLTGENGILTKGSDAKLATEQAEILEKLRMEIYENRLDIESNVTEIQFLKNKEIITKEVSQERETVGKLGKYASIHHELSIAKTENSGSDTCYIIDVSKVIQNPTTGKGSWEKGDVYYILKGDLYYKDKDMQSKKQGEVFKMTEPTGKIEWIYHANADGNIEIIGMDIRKMDPTDISGIYNGEISVNLDAITIPEKIDGKKVVKFNWSELLYGEGVDALSIFNVKELVFPDEIKEISFDGNDRRTYLRIPELETIHLSKNLESFDTKIFESSELKSISISEENQNYSTEQGVLFNKEKTELLHYPRNKSETEYSVPDSVTSINGSMTNRYLVTVNISNKVKNMQTDFAFFKEVTGNRNVTLNFPNGKNEELSLPNNYWGAKSIIIEGTTVYPK